MASLLTTTTPADVNSTLEVWSKHGVTAEDLRFIRKYHKRIGKHIAEEIKAPRRLYETAIGTDESAACDAIRQLQQIGDLEIFKDIYKTSSLSAVWTAVIEHIASMDQWEAYKLICVCTNTARCEAVHAGLRCLSGFILHEIEVDEDTARWVKDLVRIVRSESD